MRHRPGGAHRSAFDWLHHLAPGRGLAVDGGACYFLVDFVDYNLDGADHHDHTADDLASDHDAANDRAPDAEAGTRR